MLFPSERGNPLLAAGEYINEAAGRRRAEREARREEIGNRLLQTWPAEAVRAAYEAVTLPGDVYAGRVDPMSDEGIGRAAELAGLVTLGSAAMPAPRGAVTMGAPRRIDDIDDLPISVDDAHRYLRRSRSADAPHNANVGFSMFAEAHERRNPLELADMLSSYGPNVWVADGKGAVDVREIMPDIVRVLRREGMHTSYQRSAADLARSAAPDDIIDSAGLWDSPELVEIVWREVLEPRGITEIRTPDGLLYFGD